MEKLSPGIHEDLEANLRGYAFADKKRVRIQPLMRSRIPLIKVHWGFWCPYQSTDGTRCCVVNQAKRSIKQHMKVHGKKLDKEKLPPKECDCQTIFVGASRKHFPVAEDEARESGLVYRLFLEQKMSKAKEPAPKPVERFREGELPSLVQTAKWHNWVEDYQGNPKDIIDLIECPGIPKADQDPIEQLLMRLPSISEEWMD